MILKLVVARALYRSLVEANDVVVQSFEASLRTRVGMTVRPVQFKFIEGCGILIVAFAETPEDTTQVETYRDQAAFATAYGLS
jgi:hypothetical protein